MKEDMTIQNGNGENIALTVQKPKSPVSIAVIIHGLGGSQKSEYIRLLTESCLNQNLIIVTFDCRHSFSKSDGDFEDATVSSYLEDLNLIMDWVKTQEWYIPKLFLLGHSLGGLCILEYVKINPEDIIGIAPIATVISGELSCQTKKYSDGVLENWKKTGWHTFTPKKTLPYSHMQDRLKYDALKYADKITQEVLLIVGELDKNTPVVHQKKLQEKIQSNCELHVIPQMEHSPRTADKNTKKEIQIIVESWVGKIVMRQKNE